MGVVNVTPDSFSDGGRFLDARAAIAHGRELAAQGAEIVDVGGESTRPGAQPVGGEEEVQRVLPVVEALVGVTLRVALEGGDQGAPGETARAVQVSIDTAKASVAQAALAAGASFVNDVTALRGDARMAEVVAQGGVECCLMHMRGDPRTMQQDPRYDDVVDDVKAAPPR
jgi:dihydropteroate synthase